MPPVESNRERERRRYPRILTDIDLDFDCMGVKSQEKANVLSGGGLFVVTERADLVESDVAVKFQPSPTSPLIEALGKVCYHVPGVGMGIEFTEIREEHRQHILKLIKEQLGERRTSKRVTLVTQVRKVDVKETAVGYSKNVNLGGVFVETENPFAPGQQSLIRFKLKPDGRILEVLASVVYSIAGRGMALKFLDLSADARREIRTFIEERSG